MQIRQVWLHYAHVILTLLHDALGCHKELRVLSNDFANGCSHMSAFQQAANDFTALHIAETPLIITQTPQLRVCSLWEKKQS